METKKEQIADVFKKHVTHFGYKKTSVDEIAKELKISKKTIYKFFSTKEKIFYYVIGKIAKQLCKKMEKDISKFDTQTEKITQLVTIIFLETKKWLNKGNDAFEFKFKFEIAELSFKEAYNELFLKLIIKGIESKEFEIDDPKLIISFINGIFSESMKLVSVNPDINIEKDVIAAILKLLK